MVDKIIIEVPESCESCFFFKQYLYCSLDAGILFTDNGVRGLEPTDKCPGPGNYRMTLEPVHVLGENHPGIGPSNGDKVLNSFNEMKEIAEGGQ